MVSVGLPAASAMTYTVSSFPSVSLCEGSSVPAACTTACASSAAAVSTDAVFAAPQPVRQLSSITPVSPAAMRFLCMLFIIH